MIVRTCLWLLAACAGASASLQLEIHYPVIEKHLAGQMFTAEGRHYVRGSRDTKCGFAYLENPRITASGGRLVITTKFAGRSAVDLLGACVGLGDSFDMVIRATPRYEDGLLILADVEATTSAFKNLYVTRVLRAMQEELPRKFRYPLRDEAKALLEQKRDASYRLSVSAFHVVSVQAANHGLVLILDFRLEVK